MFPGQPKKAVWTYYSPYRLHLIYVSYPIYRPAQFNYARPILPHISPPRNTLPSQFCSKLGSLARNCIWHWTLWKTFVFLKTSLKCRAWCCAVMQIRRSAEKEEGNVWQQLMEVLPRARYFTFPSSCPPCVLYFIHSTTESQAVDALTIEIHTSTTLNKTSKITDIHINKTNLYSIFEYHQDSPPQDCPPRESW